MSAEADPLASFLGEWVRFYGPFRRELLTGTLGLPEPRVREALEALIEQERVVVDDFRRREEEAPAAEEDLEVCDAGNLEILLRLLRAASRPAFEALPLARLPLFLAVHQGLYRPGDGGLEDLRRALEKLFGYPAPAASWEADLLPARLAPYYPSWLDTLMQESDLVWAGTGRERLTFAFASDLDLFLAPADGESGEPETAAAPLSDLFPEGSGKLPFDDLLERSGLASAALTERLWEAAWEGRVTNSTFAAVRQGLLHRFRPIATGPSRPGTGSRARRTARPSRRRAFDRWQTSRPFGGDWYRLEPPGGGEPPDALEAEELNMDRARQLLARYGLLFRELLARELPALSWNALLRTLRRMELSGEVLTGHFFDGIPGLQFLSPAAFHSLREGLPEDAVFWMSAADPASPCGLGLDGLRGELPPRLASNHLVFHGERRVVVSRRNGGELEIAVAPDHPHLPEYLEFLAVLLTRESQPVRSVEVETINGEAAAESPYAGRLSEHFSATREPKSLKLRRRY